MNPASHSGTTTPSRKVLATCAALLASVLGADAAVTLLTGDANNRIYNSDAYLVDVSADGDLVLFSTSPPVAGFGTAAGITKGGLYVRRVSTNTLTYVDDPTVPGSGDASFSNDGRYLAFRDTSSFIYWRDSKLNVTRRITPAADGGSSRPIMSADGRYVAYASIARNIVSNKIKLQPVGLTGVYLYDSVTKSTTVVSLTHSGGALNSGIGSAGNPVAGFNEFDFSSDGKFIVFSSDATNVHPDRASTYPAGFLCIYRRNLSTGAVELLNKSAAGTVADGNFSAPRVNANGNRVSFFGANVGLFGGSRIIDSVNSPFGSELYVKEVSSDKVWWASKTIDNSLSDGVFFPTASISGNGQTVAFSSTGTKHINRITDPGDTEGYFDIFRADLALNGSVKTTMVSAPADGRHNVIPFSPALLPYAGQYVAFGTSQVEVMAGIGLNDSIFSQGFAVSLPAPEITVQQPLGTTLVDGKSKKGFGSIAVGARSTAATFTIKNTGTAPLTGLAVSKNGTNATDFLVGALGKTSLAVGASTTFTVTFKPTATGVRAAAIHIASNDANENPFDISLSGSGL